MPPARRPPARRGTRGPQRQPPPRRPPGRARRPPAEPREPRRRSDLFARIIVAIPAAVLAIVFVDLGGLAFALFMIAIGLVVHARALPDARALAAGARSSDLRRSSEWCSRPGSAGSGTSLEVAIATLPILFLGVLTRPQQGGATIAIAGTLLGVFWIGFAFAHAVLLRDLHTRQRDPDRHSRRHVPRATPPRTSAAVCSVAARSRRRSRRTRRSRDCSCGMFVAVLSVFFAGLFQSTWLHSG